VPAECDSANTTLRTQPFHQLPSSSVRQTEIAKQNIKLNGGGKTEGGLHIRRNKDLVPDGGEKSLEAFGAVGVIFDYDQPELFVQHGV
jgi:hypothetical protein